MHSAVIRWNKVIILKWTWLAVLVLKRWKPLKRTRKVCLYKTIPPTKMMDWLIVLGFNDTSTLEGHFVSSPREREKRDRRESNEREGQGWKRNRNESEETEEIKTFPPLPLPTTRIAGLAQLYANISWTPQWCKMTNL